VFSLFHRMPITLERWRAHYLFILFYIFGNVVIHRFPIWIHNCGMHWADSETENNRWCMEAVLWQKYCTKSIIIITRILTKIITFATNYDSLTTSATGGLTGVVGMLDSPVPPVRRRRYLVADKTTTTIVDKLLLLLLLLL